MMIIARLLGGCILAAALILPLPVLAAVGLLCLSMVLFAPSVVATALLLAAESPSGRATILTINVSALGLGQGLGGAIGGIALVQGGWAAVGLCSCALLVTGPGSSGGPARARLQCPPLPPHRSLTSAPW
jgi:predicted MFS family arabinose efflux permease